MIKQKKYTILVADDEPNVRRIAKLLIDESQYNIVTAENGQDAYEKAIEFKPDIIFSDILMPKCDGFELCERIKTNSITKDISFVLLSADGQNPFTNRPNTVNADDFLVKPFTSDEITSKINMLISNSTLEQSNKRSEKSNTFQIGVPELDHQLYDKINARTFILVRGNIGSGTSHLNRQFLRDGLTKEQHGLLMSFDYPKKENDPIFNLNDKESSYFHFCDASQWSTLNSSPWRNIHHIFDTLFDICSTTPIQRIVIDSLSHGLPFWSTTDILKLINLCRELPNADNQCILWTFTTHTSTQEIEFHLSNVMDIGITLEFNKNIYTGSITHSKWQPFTNKPVLLQRT